MIITSGQIQYIETNLSFYGIKDADLREDLVDHICTHIEADDNLEFETSYQKAIVNLGGYGAMQILQKDITEKQIIRGFLVRKKIFYMLSSFTIMIIALGLIFKLNQWPYSTILLATGFSLLVFAVIPFWFYERYQHNAQKIKLQNQ